MLEKHAEGLRVATETLQKSVDREAQKLSTVYFAQCEQRFAEKKEALIAQCEQRLAQKDAEIAAAEQARDSIAEQAVGLQARVHALQYHAGEAPVEDTTSKEYVAQLEREFAWFEQMFDENWKKTKKRIRKELLWSSKKKTDR